MSWDVPTDRNDAYERHESRSPRTGIRSQRASLTGFFHRGIPFPSSGEQGNNQAPSEFHFFKGHGRRFRAQRQLAMRPVSCESYDRWMLTQPATRLMRTYSQVDRFIEPGRHFESYRQIFNK